MKIIKRLAALSIVASIGLSAFSCMESEDYDNTIYGYLPATEITILPKSVTENSEGVEINNFDYYVNDSLKLDIQYLLTNECQQFEKFDNLTRDIDETNRSIFIGVLGVKKDSIKCNNFPKYESKVHKVKLTQSGENLIKVWNGIDKDRKNTYIEVSIDVK